MRVLHILNSNRFSGAENIVCQIIGLFDHDETVHMAYCSPDGPIKEALRERNVEFLPVPELTVKELSKVIDRFDPDVIHAHDMKASVIASLCRGRRKLIFHIHNNAFDSRRLSLKSIAFYFAAKRAEHIFWVSQSAYNGYRFHQSFEKKSSVLYNILDIDKLYDRMSSDTDAYDYDLIFLGRLSEPKNPHRLIRILKKLTEKRPETSVAIVGTGELEAEVKAEAEELGLPDNVVFLGFQSNPLKMLHDSKLMIMTSLWEGTPMCALEAMALGTPIVSTPVDGLKVLIKNDENGYLSDDDEEIADKIIQYLSDRDLLDHLSAAQIAKAGEWNDKTTYKNLISEHYFGK